jgi:dolichyl-phosphate beta-glucosyltransferase
MKCGIVIPAYKEENRIKTTLEEYGKFFSKQSKIPLTQIFQILISVNGPKDNTIAIIKEAMTKYPIINYIYTSESGKGLAVKLGFDYLLKQKDITHVCYADADMSTAPEELYKLIIKCSLSKANITANRYDPSSVLNPAPGIKRILASRIFNFIVRSMFPSIHIQDTQCGAKVFNVKDIETIMPTFETTNWAFDINILYALIKNNCKIIQVPTFWSSKDYSKVKLGGAAFKMILSLIRLRIVNSPFKGFMRLYNRIPEKLKFHHQV